MSVAVIGCGRSGTNLTLEILRGNSHLFASKEVENKKLCTSNSKYKLDYLTKCDTHYIATPQFKAMLCNNIHMKVIWTMRDPRDMILSKIKRGQPKSQGGDGSNRISDDATPKGAVKSILHMIEIYRFAVDNFSERLLLVRMEDVIRDIEFQTRKMCSFLEIPFEITMLDFIPRVRNSYKKKRYQCLDKNQISLWKNWRAIYDNFFTTHKYSIEEIFLEVDDLVKEFGYNRRL